MMVQPIRTRIFKEGESLVKFITEHVKNLPDKSVFVVTSKIVALAERRTAPLGTEKQKEKLIRAESEWAVETKYVWLTIKDGLMMPTAGIDESNSQDRYILLPKDSFKTAQVVRKALMKQYKLKQFGVVITDSRTFPLRAGTAGVSLGHAGFQGLKDYRKQKDIFGRLFVFSRVNVADGLAAAAVLEMGEGSEQQPLALIKKPPVEFVNRVKRTEMLIDMEDDMYRPLFVSKVTKKRAAS